MSYWPELNQRSLESEVPEMKTYILNNKNTNTTNGTDTASAPSKVIDFTRYSKLSTLQRAFAYVKRFIHNTRNRNSKLLGYLTSDELNTLLMCLSKLSQQESFGNELNLLKKNEGLPAKSRILSLTPFIDETGLLRVGGRIQNAPENYNKNTLLY